MPAFNLCLQKMLVSNVATLTEQRLTGLKYELSRAQPVVIIFGHSKNKSVPSR